MEKKSTESHMTRCVDRAIGRRHLKKKRMEWKRTVAEIYVLQTET